jgi:hypothetical protein
MFLDSLQAFTTKLRHVPAWMRDMRVPLRGLPKTIIVCICILYALITKDAEGCKPPRHIEKSISNVVGVT